MKGDWSLRASCRGCDPDLFFSERGESFREAKLVCSTCPVQVECLRFAVQNGERYGIWGGLGERQRRRLHRDWRRSQKVPA